MNSIDGLVENYSVTSALEVEILQSCTKPSKFPAICKRMSNYQMSQLLDFQSSLRNYIMMFNDRFVHDMNPNKMTQ